MFRKDSILVRSLRNKYLIAVVVFFVWLLVFDRNSLVDRVRYIRTLNDLEQEKEYYIERIDEDSRRLDELKTNDDNLEKFAREQYFMKKDDEDVFVIGNDLGATTLECMDEGDCDSTVGQDMYTMGAYAFINAYMKVNQFMDHALFEGKHSVPYISPGTGLVTQETMGSLLEQVRAIEDLFR